MNNERLVSRETPIEEKIARINKKIAGLELSLEVSGQREALEQLKQKFANQIRLLGAAFLLAVAPQTSVPQKGTSIEMARVQADLENKRAHPITKTVHEDGSIIYKHWDADTTEALNYFSGRGPVTDKMLAMCLRLDMSAHLDTQGQSIEDPKARQGIYNIDTAAEIMEFYKKEFSHLSEAMKQRYPSAEDYANSRLNLMRSRENGVRENIDPRLYQALWSIFEKSGAPRIVWVDSEAERIEGRVALVGDSSYFVANDKSGFPTIYLDAAYCTEKGIDVLVQEMSHSIGYHNDRRGFEARIKREGEIEAAKFDDLDERYLAEAEIIKNESYDTNGTEEYHAHRVVFPMLLRQITPLLKKDEGIVVIGRNKR
ncbi:MAG: hypothetical protein RLZZ480_649 [Candidatus Parcubacteria bacterium]|jgi:hypothetical protein